ncbi:oligosaccharide flippase family protein [Patescibacteria group bacterium]|nr:oligosaccharide flippase family protein [Patescibacteria group bacterium]
MIAKAKEKAHAALRWSERYTKTDMIYLAGGQFWAIIGQVVSSVTVFIFAIIVARYLPKDVYGEYKYIIGVVALLSSFSLTGLSTAVFQSAASGFDGSLHEGFWQNIKWSVLVFLGAFGLAAYYFTQGDHILAYGVLIGGTLSPLLASANLIAAFLNAKKDFRRTALYIGVIETLLSSGALIITIFLAPNPLTLATVYFLGNTLATLWIYRRIAAIYQPDHVKTDPGMMTYAKHLSAMGILSTIAANIDQVLLFHFVGPVQLAIYNFATAIPDQTKGPLNMFNTMTQAKFVDRTDKEVRTGMRNKIFWLALSSTLFVALYILLAPYFFAIFFPKYMEAVFYSQIYAISILTVIFTPAASYLIAKKKVREQYVNNIAVSLFQIGSMVIGVIGWGLLGLVIARIATRFFGSSLVYLLYARTSNT